MYYRALVTEELPMKDIYYSIYWNGTLTSFVCELRASIIDFKDYTLDFVVYTLERVDDEMKCSIATESGYFERRYTLQHFDFDVEKLAEYFDDCGLSAPYSAVEILKHFKLVEILKSSIDCYTK